MIPKEDSDGRDVIRSFHRFSDLVQMRVGDLCCSGFRVYRKRFYFQELDQRARGIECRLVCRYVLDRLGGAGSLLAFKQWVGKTNSLGMSLSVEPEFGSVWHSGQVAFLCVYQARWIVGFSSIIGVRMYFRDKQVRLLGKNAWDSAIFM